jgi:hypothetical protein
MRGKAIWHEEAKSFQQIELQIRGTALKDLRRHGFSLSRAERVLPASDGGLGSHRSPPSVSPSSSSGGTMIFWVAKKSVMGVHNFFFRSWMVERGIPTVRETLPHGHASRDQSQRLVPQLPGLATPFTPAIRRDNKLLHARPPSTERHSDTAS